MNRPWGVDGKGANAQRLGKSSFPASKVGEKRVMIEFILLRRWTVRCLGLLVLLSAMVLGGAALAQHPSSAQLPKLTYTAKTVFRLPVQMDERTRANVREVCLYVTSGT